MQVFRLPKVIGKEVETILMRPDKCAIVSNGQKRLPACSIYTAIPMMAYQLLIPKIRNIQHAHQNQLQRQ